MAKAVFVIVISYLIGSISFSLLTGKLFYGTDVREEGSGNLGATNTLRVLGTLPGILVLLGDALKGVFAVGLANFLFKGAPTIFSSHFFTDTVFLNYSTLDTTVVVLAGFAVIAGHNWSIFLKFSGGKGIATSAGVLLALAPKVILILLMIWLITVVLTRHVSLGSVTVAAVLPFFMIYFYQDNYPYIIFSIIASLVAIYKHRSNLKRLLKGEESKIGRKTR